MFVSTILCLSGGSNLLHMIGLVWSMDAMYNMLIVGGESAYLVGSIFILANCFWNHMKNSANLHMALEKSIIMNIGKLALFQLDGDMRTYKYII